MKRIVGLCLALVMGLSSCAFMLEREYTVAEEHQEDRPAQTEAYRVETYPALRAALLSYVEEGVDEGALRVSASYPGNLTVDLEKAKRQLMEEEPLGCYALSDVTFHTSKLIAYYEVNASFDYRVSAQEARGVATVRNADALDSAVKAALGDFRERFAVLLSIPGEEEPGLIEASLRRVYDQNPDLALGYPELEITYYPETGTRRVAEVTLTYPERVGLLRQRQGDMLQAARDMADELEADPFAIHAALVAQCAYDPDGGDTAAHALLDGVASDEGRARAYDLLCKLKGLDTAGVAYGPEGWQCAVETEERSVVMGFKPGGV